MRTLESTPGATKVERLILIGIVSAAVLSMTSLVPLAGEILILTGVGLGWWLVPAFWRSVLFGAIAGVISGVLVLGVGFRIAMRVVAILDPFRVPEFSFGGTMFILIGIGGIFGGIIGMLTNLARRGLRLRSIASVALLPAAGPMILLFVDDEIRRELFELGAGAWVNIPMFGLVTVLYGIAVSAVVLSLEERSAAKRAVIEKVEVPA
jgi:hypothetical protein